MFLEEQKNGFRVYKDDFGDVPTAVASIEVFVDDDAEAIRIVVARLEEDPTVSLTVL